ncbi:MAG: MauE/DoxX family redox-associated membrane protein [Solirubrobacteraceae bacterium]
MSGVAFLCSAAVAFAFFASAAAAVRDWAGFRDAGNRLRGHGGSLSTGVAASVVGVEAVCAVARCIPAGGAARLGIYAATAMLVLFTGVLWRAIRAGVAGGCHCFGASDDQVGSMELLRTVLLLVLSACAAFAIAFGAAPLPRLGLVVALLGPAAALGLLVINLGPIVRVLRGPLSDD